jgi:hypothetical protein
MSIEPSATIDEPTAETTARLYLDRVMALVGVDGLAEALAAPGLLAQIDQHAAAVRNSLWSADKDLNPISLAGYARSVLAVHQRHGRPTPEPSSVDWANPGWTVLRLVAVCSLAESTDCL